MESGAMPPDPTPPTPLTRRCAACLGASLKALALSLLCAGGLHVPAALAATTFQIGDGSGARIEGSGRVGEEVRTTAPFSALTVAGPVDVQLKAGTAPRVTVRADDNLLPVITTEVIDRRLEVGVKPQTRARTRNKMVVVVEFTELTGILVRGSGDVDADRIQAALFEIVLRGSGDVKIERLEADALALSITGSGDVTVGGSSRALGVDLFGSGDVRADRLESRQVAVRIRGSGDARVHAVEVLQVEISGSGDVRYRGTPQIQQKISGSGELLPLR
jgi:hypothetical protein